MSSRIHDGGKRLQFGAGSPNPVFRHPYDKYGSRVSEDSFNRKIGCYQGGAPDRAPDLARKRSRKNGRDGRGKNGRKGLEERNTLICQTFLTENPFFGAYYPAIRPRSADEVSNKGSEKSRSPSTDFDDSKTYKIIYTGDSVCNENHDSLEGNKSKKTDDIHHFHEHHHFFHDKNDESSNPTYYDKYQYGKGKEQAKSSIADTNKSFLKQPIQESCMIYQVEEDRNQRLDLRELKKEKSQEGQRHLSRSSSKSGKKSSDNETYTVICEHCQKLLRDYPNARIVGHENIPVRLSGESYDKRVYAPHGYNSDSVPKTNWKPANIFVAEPQHQVHRLNVSQDSPRWKKTDRTNAGPMGKPFIPFNVESWPKPEKSRENVMPKVPSRESSLTDSDSRSLIFKCDHCKSIIETKSRTRERLDDTTTTSTSSEKGRGFSEKTSKIGKSKESKENFSAKTQVKGSATTKRSSLVSERKSSSYKGIKGSSGGTLVKKVSSSQRVSSKVPSQKLSKSYTLSDKKKISLQRTSRPSRVIDRAKSSGSRGSKEPTGGEKRSSSYSATRDASFPNEIRSSSYKERRASSELSKRNDSGSKGLRETSASGKRISSSFKDSNELKQKSLVYKEPSKGKKVGSSIKTSRESARADKASSYKKSLTSDKITCSTYTELDNTCSVNTRSSSNRKEKDSSVKRFEKTESNLKKVETEKSRVIQTEDRSMQTSSRKLVTSNKEIPEPVRSSTASKTVSKSASTKESARSGTAPGSLVNSVSIDPKVKSKTTRGSSTISRRTVASKETPVVQLESTPEAKQSSRIAGIQTEITDLKTQLDRLEALHNMKTEAPEPSGNVAHEPIECPKHPIVVCTSTTYIMTKCPTDFGDRKSAASTPREPEKIPPKEKESPPESSSVEEPSASKCKRFCCSEINQPHRVGVASAERATKTRYSIGAEPSPFRTEQSRASCQFIGARITRAINKVCHCPNRELLSRYCETPGRTKSCDRGETSRRLFGNGKNQRRNWLRSGRLTRYCNDAKRKNVCCCTKCYHVTVPDLKNFPRRSYSDAVGPSERLITYQSYSTVHRDYDLLVKAQDRVIHKESSGSRSSVRNDVEIDETSGPGFFLRTSISDVCEYRNGSLIRLIGRSGWIVYTKRLFLDGSRKNLPPDYPKNFDEFAIFPTSTSTTRSKSATNIKETEKISDPSRESNLVIYLNQRQVWSDSSFYIPLAYKALHDQNIRMGREKSASSVYLSDSARMQNRGISNFREFVGAGNDFPNELYLLDCKSAADRKATCADNGGNGPRCTCRRRRRETRKGGEVTGTKQRKEKVPVLFEEMKSQRGGSRDGRKASDVSLKCVFAEKSRDSERANKVIWSTDGNGSRIKKPCVFGVSKGMKNRRNREHFSMNDKQRKNRWHRLISQKNKESDYGTNKPEGDSPQNRCACCSCSPNHPCSAACEKEEEELTGIRKLLKDLGITGLSLGFSRRTPYCRPGFSRPQNTDEEQAQNVGSQNENYYDDFRAKEKEEEGVAEEVKEEIIEDDAGGNVTYLKKVSSEERCCDCAKQLEQLLAQAELCKQVPLEAVSLKHESWDEDWNVGSRKDSAESTKKEPFLNPDVLDDISLQRRRITECENLLKQFEIQLEDVRRQSEACACKCEESLRQEEPQRQEESHSAPEGQKRDTILNAVQNNEVEFKTLPELKFPIPKDDGCIRFEGKILTQLTAKRSTRSVGCGGITEEFTKPGPTVQTPRKTHMVKNATQMTSDIVLQPKDNHDSERFIKEINFEMEESPSGAKKNSEDCVHACCNLTPKIEMCCERTICTCEKCSNIHFVNKHYPPANCYRKCHSRNSETKAEAATYVPRPKKEIFTNASERVPLLLKRHESTSYRDLLRPKKTEGCKPKKEEVAPVSHRPTTKDEATSTACKPKKDEGVTTIHRSGKNEAISTIPRAKKDEATSLMCKQRKEEVTVIKAKREEVLSHKEISRPKVESAPVRTTPKVMKEEERHPIKDEVVEADRSRFGKESESISESERFVNQSDLEKTPSEEDNEDCSSKDIPHVASAKNRTREVVCDCSKTSATEKCEDNPKCDCASKGIQCAERRKLKRFCECGSKLKLIEDRLRALEERKKASESTISSLKERKETTEESSSTSEKIPRSTSDSSIVSEKEREISSEVVSSIKGPQKEASEESSASYPKEKQLSKGESNVTHEKRTSVRLEAEKNETTESSSLTEKSSSLENIESETDVEIKTKVITCHNMNFFDGGDPNVKTKCQCMEDSFCPFKYFHNNQDVTSAKNIFFVTNIDLLRQWSGMYGCGEYSYCKNFWNVNESALKSVKLPRDWKKVKTAVASFFRSCKLRKKKFTLKRRQKSDGESSVSSAASRSNVTSGSEDSFLDDCSRSGMPLKRRSFHILARSPRPTRPVKERKKIDSDKKRRKRDAL